MNALQAYDEAYETEWDDELPVSEDGKAISEREYWADYYEHPDFSYEWNNGYLEERPVSDYSGYLMYSWFVGLLQEYLKVHPIAKIVGLEIGFRMVIPGKTVVRKPDLGVVLNSNPAALFLKDRSYHGIYDMCIEALSDSSGREVKRDTEVKKQEYESGGVKEYFILDPKKTNTVFYRYSNHGFYIPIRPIEKDVIRSHLLPGFQFRISDLYAQPSSEQMAEDSLYQSFVFTSYQAEKRKAEKERQRAEQERQRADLEKQNAERQMLRAERLAAKLRALGITEDLETA